MKDPHSCAIGRYFDRHGLHDTSFGQAHKEFHEVIMLYDTDGPRFQAGSDAFRKALLCEIAGGPDGSGPCCAASPRATAHMFG